MNIPDNWILTAAGHVYLCSQLGEACAFEDVAGEGVNAGYLDSLDCYRADPDVEAAVLASLRGERR